MIIKALILNNQLIRTNGMQFLENPQGIYPALKTQPQREFLAMTMQILGDCPIEGQQQSWGDSPSADNCQSKAKPDQSPQKPALRQKWNQVQNLFFFVFLGKQKLDCMDIFLDWKTPNKKSIFKRMASTIPNKNQQQCKLKFATYKRKYYFKSGQNREFDSMTALLLAKLRHYSSSSQQCKDLLQQILKRSQQTCVDSFGSRREQKPQISALTWQTSCNYTKTQSHIHFFEGDTQSSLPQSIVSIKNNEEEKPKSERGSKKPQDEDYFRAFNPSATTGPRRLRSSKF